MEFSTIITAGGKSSRYSKSKNKLLEKINCKEILRYTVDVFEKTETKEIIIPTNPSIIEEVRQLFRNNTQIKIIEGGKTRQSSVFKGLQYVQTPYVLIHDGARPLINLTVINNVINELPKKRAITVMTKTTDTIKEVDENGRIIMTLDRDKLYNTQTPQAFDTELIKKVHKELINSNFTDDAGMVEYCGYDVYMVEGDYRNIKITTESDLQLALSYLKE